MIKAAVCGHTQRATQTEQANTSGNIERLFHINPFSVTLDKVTDGSV